jgi:hypothetical protein
MGPWVAKDRQAPEWRARFSGLSCLTLFSNWDDAMRVLSELRYRCATTKVFATSRLRAICVAAWMMGFVGACYAETPSVQMIEEDWEMVINEPDPNSHSPQVTFFTAPCADCEHTYFQLQMNYAADEGFSGGGFDVAAVNNETVVDEERSTTKVALTTAHDHVRWTNVMALIDGKLYFAVKSGHCNDWGAFGGPEYLVEMETELNDLSGYQPQQSVDTVDIGFGGNRVNSVTLRAVIFHYADGTVEKMQVNQQF